MKRFYQDVLNESCVLAYYVTLLFIYVWLLHIACFCILFQNSCSVYSVLQLVLKSYTKDNSQLLLIYILYNFDEQLFDYSENKNSYLGYLYICVHSRCDSMHKAHLGSSQTKIPAWREGVSHEIPLPAEEIFAVMAAGKGRVTFFLQGCLSTFFMFQQVAFYLYTYWQH